MLTDVERQKLSRGLKISDADALTTLTKWLEENRTNQLVREEFGWMIDGLDFLREVHACEVPEGEYDKFITVRHHWISVSGYFSLSNHLERAARQGLNQRWVINTLAVNTRVLIMNYSATRLFNFFLEASGRIAYLSDAIRFVIIALRTIQSGVAESTHILSDEYLRWLFYNLKKDPPQDFVSKSVIAASHLGSCVHDPDNILQQIVSGNYVVPVRKSVYSDGWTHVPVVPQWTLSRTANDETADVLPGEIRASIDLSNNVIDDWTYFT